MIDKTSLREEIALMRLCIEERFNSCKDQAELVAQSPFINAQMLVMEKLVKAQHAIDKQRVKDIDAVMKTIGDAAADLMGVVIQEINLSDVEINKIADALLAKIKSKKRRGTK